ncbi:MAG TPA: hypothetical protein VMC82_05720 [Thermoplasmata archaeon]|nr:hypothetical protein [Thermoplasmata archaeon]
MPTEMISGPDLGAGYLHQLSTDRDGDRTTFTYHAQDGGQDANGPPKGPLDAFGFVHPPSSCQFGGPRCWHRRFLVPFADTPRVRQTYNRNRFVLQTMIDQRFDRLAVPIEPALAEVVERIAKDPELGPDDWFVGGSTAAWLLGARIAPNDLDLGASRRGVDRLAADLAEYLIEPLGTTDWPSAGIVRAARAFVGTFAAGARVEWSVPLDPASVAPLAEWSGRVGVARLVRATFRERPISVSRPEYALVRAAEKGAEERVRAIADSVRTLGADVELLDVLLERSTLPAARREALRRSVVV